MMNKSPAFFPFLAVCALGVIPGLAAPSTASVVPTVGYRLQRDVLFEGFDGKTCWMHPRAGAIPGKTPVVVMTLQKELMGSDDYYFPLNEIRTEDLGATWSKPVQHDVTLGRKSLADGVEVAALDFTPKWHARTERILGIGHSAYYQHVKLMKVRPRQTIYAVYDAQAHTWSQWQKIDMPDEQGKFFNSGAGAAQRVDLPNGDILLPFYFKSKEQEDYRVAVMRCSFDGKKLSYREHGNELVSGIERGFVEPSLTRFQGRYFMTIRNDRNGYITTSTDGLQYAKPQVWRFDDGQELGSYNTQQHWVTHSDGLFLVYTRKGANNDHIIRHRAPLFIAQVDPDRLCVIRGTEKILLPELGAYFGNFGVTEVNENETWVTDAEGMIRVDMNKYAARNRVYAARLIWGKPNRLMSAGAVESPVTPAAQSK